jgi:hypothetical protein
MAGQSFESEALGPAAIADDRNALANRTSENAGSSRFFIALSKSYRCELGSDAALTH